VDVTDHLDRKPIPTAIVVAPKLGLGSHLRRDDDPARAELTSSDDPTRWNGTGLEPGGPSREEAEDLTQEVMGT
jgi:hypothetical protein